MHDSVICVDGRDFGQGGRLMIALVVVMRRRPVVVSRIDAIGRRMHMQHGRLHVHPRESGDESEREQPTKGGNQRVSPIVLHSAQSDVRRFLMSAGTTSNPTC